MIDTIPQEVLHDYQNRHIMDAKNPVWSSADHTSIDADVLFEELEPLGYVPFTARQDGDTIHEQQLWAWANEGKYGAIGEYVPPPPPEPTLYERVEALEREVRALKAKA